MESKKQKYHFDTILLSGGWDRDVTLEVGGDGLISGISKGEGGEKVTGIGVPAILNAHSHAFQRAFVGLTERRGPEGDDFWAWREVMYRALKTIGPKEFEAIATWLYIEMLKSGYAGVAEFHYFHHRGDGAAHPRRWAMADAVLRAAKASGIGLLMLPVLYQRSGFDGKPVTEGQKPFYNSLEDFRALMAHLGGKCRLGVAPHSLRAVGPEALAEAIKMTNGPIHIHVAEQTKEVDDCLAATGKRPVEWLLDNFDVDQRWNLVHATHMTGAEAAALAKTGAAVILCPTTEGNLGDGFFPFRTYRQAGGRFAIGTDSHISIDPREELRLLEYSQRLLTRKRAIAGVNPGAALWKAASEGGARAFGYEKAGLEVGAPAHIAVLDKNAPALCGHEGDELLDALVFAGQPSPVKDVMVFGDWKVRDGRHPGEEAAFSAYRKAISAL